MSRGRKNNSKPENERVEVLDSRETVLVVRPVRALTVREFQALSAQLKSEEEITGQKLVLLPFSAELVEVKETGTEKSGEDDGEQ